MKNKILSFLKYFVVIVLAFFILLPFLWMLSTALKSKTEAIGSSLTLLPKDISWGNFKEAWEATNFPRMFMNSIIVAVSVSFFQILTSGMAGYAFARMNFKGRKVLFSILLATLVIPFQMVSIPIYLMFNKMHLVNTYAALILPSVANAFGIFLFKQFFSSIPYSIEEAAKIDGCNRFQILFKIMFPLAKSAVTTLFLFTFIAEWNDLFKPLIFTTTEDMRTIQMGLSVFQEQFSTNYTLLMAAALFITVPTLIIFLLGQKQFVEGIASSGMK